MKLMKTRKWIGLLSVVLVAGILTVGCGAKEDAASKEKTGTEEAETSKTEDKTAISGKHHVEINVKDYGTIKVELDADTAPITVENFMTLAEEGFYDGLTFHRIIDGFMIQGGDPNTKDTTLVEKYGQGGPGYTIPAEIIPDYRHKKGALAAARRGDAANPERESSGSHFYLVQSEETCAQLDGAYTVFGETVEGLDVIDRIAKVATDRRDRPISDVRIISIKLDPICVPQEKEAADSSKTE